LLYAFKVAALCLQNGRSLSSKWLPCLKGGRFFAFFFIIFFSSFFVEGNIATMVAAMP
jgi:hypothetical protein